MRILRATHLGMCFGVKDAIRLAQEASDGCQLTILGELVHNQEVNKMLADKGVRIAAAPDEISTRTVMVSSHGASQGVLRQLHESGLNVIEATCPLVRLAHRQLAELAAMGCHPVVIGKRDHVEVKGLVGDFPDASVILMESDVEGVPARRRYGVISQTTQPEERVRELLRVLREVRPDSEVIFRDTVCRPTKQRQNAAVELARQCDLVLVLGALHSNNTRELAAVCRRFCARVIQLETPSELRFEWLTGVGTVGITAGTSTPGHVIDAVEQKLQQWVETPVLLPLEP
ncbi:MAG: 4-hydroxy-3-methylbut-2-enyl diphosphate reductase [Verrucomicrobiae bacterium]|nr:4-hydroxy-3-methylbut-2-enyl diphosphate reductase [Verrucomicrobiae bacterium]